MPSYKRGLAKSTRWYFRIRHLGLNFTSKAIYPTRKECQQAEREKTKELEEEMRRPKSAMKLKALMEKRLDFLQEHKSKEYYEDAKRCFKKLLSAVGDIPVFEVKKKDVYELLMEESARLKKDGRTQHKANSFLRALKALFNWGNRIYDLDVKNPCNLDFIKIDRTVKLIPSDEEVSEIRDKLSKEQKLLFDFVDQTACRVMEAVRLTEKDIKGEYLVLYTRKAKNSDLTPRVIPIPTCIQGMKFEGRLFKSWTAYPRFLGEKTNGWAFHNLRHRRASIWANNGMSVFDIMNRLGHQNMSVTMGYLQMLGVFIQRQNGDR